MSGGRFDYIQYRLDETAERIEEAIANNNVEPDDEWDRARNYPPEILAAFREGVKSVRQTREMIHAIDYLLSGDYSEDSFLDEWALIGEQR